MNKKTDPDCEKENSGGFRCFCGQLLARITESGVQIKCRRCKRIQIIAWDQAGI